MSAKGFTNATPAIWAIPDYFNKLYLDARVSANSLKNSIDEDDVDSTFAAMCNLGKACGTYANFRRLLTNQLANEVSGWSGQYIKLQLIYCKFDSFNTYFPFLRPSNTELI